MHNLCEITTNVGRKLRAIQQKRPLDTDFRRNDKVQLQWAARKRDAAVFAHANWCWHRLPHLTHTHKRCLPPARGTAALSVNVTGISICFAFSSLIAIATASAWSWFERLLRSLSAKRFQTRLQTQGYLSHPHTQTEREGEVVFMWRGGTAGKGVTCRDMRIIIMWTWRGRS